MEPYYHLAENFLWAFSLFKVFKIHCIFITFFCVEKLVHRWRCKHSGLKTWQKYTLRTLSMCYSKASPALASCSHRAQTKTRFLLPNFNAEFHARETSANSSSTMNFCRFWISFKEQQVRKENLDNLNFSEFQVFIYLHIHQNLNLRKYSTSQTKPKIRNKSLFLSLRHCKMEKIEMP